MPPVSPGPPKQFDRQEALERAVELFWERGFEATSLSDLVDSMRIGRQSLYDTFGDKRALFLQALEHYCASMTGPMVGELERAGSPLGNIRRVLELWKARASDAARRGCFAGNSCAELGESDPDVMRVVASNFERMERALVRTFDRAKEQGELGRGAHSRDLARLFLSLGQGLALMSRTPLGPRYVRGAVAAFESLLSATP